MYLFNSTNKVHLHKFPSPSATLKAMIPNNASCVVSMVIICTLLLCPTSSISSDDNSDLIVRANNSFDRATQLEKSGDFYGAIDSYQEAAKWEEQIGLILRERHLSVIYESIAYLYYELSQYNISTVYFEKAMRLAVRWQYWEMQASILQYQAEIQKRIGSTDSCLYMLQSALAILESNQDSSHIPDCLNSIGNVLALQGNDQMALSRYRHALNIALLRRSSHDFATSSSNVGRVFSRKCISDSALFYFSMAEYLFEKEQDKHELCQVLIYLALEYNRIGENGEALDTLLEAKSLADSLFDSNLLADVLNSMGVIYSNLALYDKAFASYKQTISILEANNDTLSEGRVFHNMGDLMCAWGDYERAGEYYGQGLDIARRFNRMESTADDLDGLSSTLIALREYDKAFAYSREALRIAQDLGQPDLVIAIMTNLAQCDFALGRNIAGFEKLKECGKQAQDINQPGLVSGIMALLGQYKEAYLKYSESMTLYENMLALAKRTNDREGVASAEIFIGNLWLEKRAYTNASTHFVNAISIIDSARGKIVGSHRRSYLQKKYEAYQSLALSYALEGDVTKSYEAYESGKSRYFLERLAGDSRLTKIVSLPDIQKALPKGSILLSYSRSERSHLLFYAITNCNVKLTVLKDDSLLTRLRKAKDYSLLCNYDSTSLLRQRIQTLLNDPSTNEDVLMQIALLLRQRLLKTNVEQINETTDDQARMDTGNLFDSLNGYYLDQALYNILIEPNSDLLAEKHNLIIEPDGGLNFIPFEALRDDSGTYLINKYSISYINSGSLLVSLDSVHYNPMRKSLLAFGGALYDADSASTPEMTNPARLNSVLKSALTDPELSESKDKIMNALVFDRIPYLPGTLQEVTGLKSAYPDADIFTGANASTEMIKSLDLTQKLTDYKIIHFASHAFVFPKYPELSAIVLSRKKDGSDNSSLFLTCSEISNLRLKADLVTLSACETGLGKVFAGEGCWGLSQSFMIAGAKAVVVSLWPVNDLATKEFMMAFYDFVFNRHMSFIDALSETKRVFIRGDRGDALRAPIYWAPFILNGVG